jgi:DNA invertase Pin-like site-specific DNA recombinase
MREALNFTRPGDVLVVWKLDRLSRSLGHLVETIQTLEKRSIAVRSLTEMLDTSRPEGSAILPLIAALCAVERNLVRERTMAGLVAARQRGRIGGRPRLFTAEKRRAALPLLADGTPPRDVANILGISIATLYRCLPASQRTAPAEAA